MMNTKIYLIALSFRAGKDEKKMKEGKPLTALHDRLNSVSYPLSGRLRKKRIFNCHEQNQ